MLRTRRELGSCDAAGAKFRLLRGAAKTTRCRTEPSNEEINRIAIRASKLKVDFETSEQTSRRGVIMKRFVVCFMCVAVVIIGWNMTRATPDAPRKFGPEWTKNGDQYRRKMEITVVHGAGGNLSAYSVPLERDTVGIVETDDNRGFELRGHPHGSFGVVKDEKGKVTELSTQMRDNIYFDLDADGMIDALFDNRGGKQTALIVFGGRFVEVEVNKAGFRHAPNEKLRVWGLGRHVEYVFDKGSWHAER
jgi:hypothetical protein